MKFEFIPYLFAAGVDGTPEFGESPPTSAAAGQAGDNLDSVFMGIVEARREIGCLLRGIYVRLEGEASRSWGGPAESAAPR